MMVELKQGDFISLVGVTAEQFNEVYDAFCDAGAMVCNLITMRAEGANRDFLGWDRDGHVYAYTICDDINEVGLLRELTLRQVIGPQEGDAISKHLVTSEEMHEAILTTAERQDQQQSFGQWRTSCVNDETTHLVYRQGTWLPSSILTTEITPQDLLGKDCAPAPEEFTAWGEEFPPAGIQCMWNGVPVFVVGLDVADDCVIQHIGEKPSCWEYKYVKDAKGFAPLPTAEEQHKKELENSLLNELDNFFAGKMGESHTSNLAAYLVEKGWSK